MNHDPTLRTISHQLGARNGQRDAASNIGIVHHARQRPTLYVLVETHNAIAAANLSAWLVSACAEAYQQARGSLTGALLAVVRAADDALRKTRDNPATSAGLSALLMHGNEVWLAQVEPAVCWLLREGQLVRWPRESVWLEAQLPETVAQHLCGGLGGESAPRPELTRITLQAGDRLLFTTSALARQAGEAVIAGALAHADPTTALHELLPAVHFSALSLTPQIIGVAASVSAPHEASVASFVPASADEITTPTETTSAQSASAPSTKTSRKRARAATTTAESTVQSSVTPEVRADQPAAIQTAIDEELLPISARPRRVLSRTPQNRDDAPKPARASRALPSFTLPAWRPYLAVGGSAVAWLLKLFGALFAFLMTMLSRVLPAYESDAPPRPIAQARRPVMQARPYEGRVLGALALGIPIIVLLGALFLRQQTSISQTNRINELLTRATQTYNAAAALPEAERENKRVEFTKAGQLVAEVLTLSPKEKTASDLQTRINGELDRLANVAKFFFYPKLYEFKETESRPATVLARGFDVYVLDSGVNRLYRFTLNETRDNLRPIAAGQAAPNPVVMPQGNMALGRFSDAFWTTAGGGRSAGGVIAVTASKQAAEHNPTKGAVMLSLGATNTWQETTIADSFNGNLYVLDAKTNRILKFTPSGDDYKNAPSDYVSPNERLDLSNAKDMAIDGFVYVLLGDGGILKFDSGHLIPFDVKGLETPLYRPTALVTGAALQSIYIADAGNQRIVQLNKQGNFVRQFKPDDPSVMNDLRGLAVDEANKRFYFVNGNKLYLGTLQN